MDIEISSYSDKALVVRGEKTKEYIQQLKEIGARYNPYLKGGAGWIISKKKESEVQNLFGKESIEEIEETKEEQSPQKCKEYMENLPINFSKNTQDFCAVLKSGDIEESTLKFQKLPIFIQCLFLYHSWHILSHPENNSENSYKTSFFLFKLFQDEDGNMKQKPIYKKYLKLKAVTSHYNEAKKFFEIEKIKEVKKSVEKNEKKKEIKSIEKKEKKEKIEKTPRAKKEYVKEYQRYESPKSELDPLYLYYTSLYSQKPVSNLAITWLTEHGVLEGNEREKLEKKYTKLKEQGKLRR